MIRGGLKPTEAVVGIGGYGDGRRSVAAELCGEDAPVAVVGAGDRDSVSRRITSGCSERRGCRHRQSAARIGRGGREQFVAWGNCGCSYHALFGIVVVDRQHRRNGIDRNSVRAENGCQPARGQPFRGGNGRSGARRCKPSVGQPGQEAVIVIVGGCEQPSLGIVLRIGGAKSAEVDPGIPGAVEAGGRHIGSRRKPEIIAQGVAARAGDYGAPQPVVEHERAAPALRLVANRYIM